MPYDMQDNQSQSNFLVPPQGKDQVSHHAMHFPGLLTEPCCGMVADFALVAGDMAQGHNHQEPEIIIRKSNQLITKTVQHNSSNESAKGMQQSSKENNHDQSKA